MSNLKQARIRDVKGITPEEKQRILDFLQGAVYCWCKNKKDKWFSLRELMGGDNANWEETPLFVLHSKHIKKWKNPKKANKCAGIDGGRLLKKVLRDENKREFEYKLDKQISNYRLVNPK